MNTTPEERAQWAELCAKATPGPWECDNRDLNDEKDFGALKTPDPPWGYVHVPTSNIQRDSGTPICQAIQSPEITDDLRFIAAARTALPRLLADYEELERLHQRTDESRVFQYEQAEKVRAQRDELERKVREFVKLCPSCHGEETKMHGSPKLGLTINSCPTCAALRAAVEKEKEHAD